MEYTAGQIHESFQVVKFIEVLNDFNLLICKDKTFDNTNLAENGSTDVLSVEMGDVISVRYFRPKILQSAYTYICTHNGKNINQESIHSMEFIKLNTQNNFLFRDLTKVIERDKKIDKILNYDL